MHNARVVPITVVSILLVAGFFLWRGWQTQQEQLPDSLATGNGRIEATEYDIASKLAGRLLEVLAEEGGEVAAGQILARMDSADLQAQLREAQAQLRQTRASQAYAEAVVAQRESELSYTKAELSRSLKLLPQGHVSQEKVDQNRTARQTAQAALQAACIQVVQAETGIEAAQAGIDRLQSNLADCELKSPIRGRVLYRLAEPGEVLAAGGKVLTVLDLADVYMTIFLATEQAGRISLGSETRIVLDAAPEYIIPARVSFVAARAQFTPKAVETRVEREKLMFRIKLKVDPQLLKQHRRARRPV